ncbi:Hypothetical protein NocV09_00902060 [Nannochloropsis oceanica]
MAEGGLLYWRRQRHDGTKYQDFDELIRPLPPPPQGMMWIKTRIVIAETSEEEEEGAEYQEGEEVSEGGQNEKEMQQDSGGLPTATLVEREEVDTAVPQVRPPRFVTRWELVERASVSNGCDDYEGGGSGKNLQGGDEDYDVSEGGEDGEGKRPAFLTHVVLPTDTMQGLRLRYKVTPADLRLHNDFAGDQFHMLQTLKIPLRQEVVSHVAKFRQRPTQAVLRQRFTNVTKCTDEQEVTYYLDLAEWNLSGAIAEYNENRAWEEAHHARVQMACLPDPSPLPFSIQAATVAAAAAAGGAPAEASAEGGTVSWAFLTNTFLASGSSTSMTSQESIPPPSYSSFFRVPRRGAQEKKKKKCAGSGGYLLSWSKLGRKKQANKAVYDMATFVEEDYVILPGAEMEGEKVDELEDVDEQGSVVAPVASLLPSSAGGLRGGGERVAIVTGEDDHPQTPLLARAAVRE